jgi:putative ABC transport system substrate-binding protein
MRSKLFFWLLMTVLLITGPTQAQQPKKVPRIGYLSNTDPAGESTRAEGIRLALRERGYIEGQNIAIEYRYVEGKLDRYPELAAELVRLKVDIIVVAGADTGVRAAKNATKTIPIVMVGPGRDPVEAGLVETIARPGGQRHRHYKRWRRTRREAGLSCSKKRFQKLPASRFSTIQPFRLL